MKLSEGKKITLELNQYEIEIILTALAREQHIRWENSNTSKGSQHVQWLIDKIYRKMGVRL